MASREPGSSPEPLNSTWHLHEEECLALELGRTVGATQSDSDVNADLDGM